MSIGGAILGLGEGAMTRSEIAKRFDHAAGRVWPARSDRIHQGIGRLAEEGSLPRDRARRYAITWEGAEPVRGRLTDRAGPDQRPRSAAPLEANFGFVLPIEERRAFLVEGRDFRDAQVWWVETATTHRPTETSPQATTRREAALGGRDHYAAPRRWAERMPAGLGGDG